MSEPCDVRPSADELQGDPRGGCVLSGSMIDCTKVGAVSVGTSARFNRGDPERTVLETPVGDPRNTHVACLSFGFNFIDNTGGELAQGWDGIARIQWGQGGTRFVAELDWHRGVHVSVPASAIVVSAFNPVNDESQAEAVMLRCAVAWGHRPSRSYPKRSFVQGIPAGDSGPVLPVPNFAFSAQLATPMPETVYVAGVTFDFFADPAGAALVQRVNGLDLRAALPGEGIKLGNPARFWRIVNGLVDPIAVVPFFPLSL